MKLIPTFAALLIAAAATASAQPPTSSVKPLPNDALFQQLGGKPGLAKLSDDFVERLWVDPRIGSFFKESNKKHELKSSIPLYHTDRTIILLPYESFLKNGNISRTSLVVGITDTNFTV